MPSDERTAPPIQCRIFKRRRTALNWISQLNHHLVAVSAIKTFYTYPQRLSLSPLAPNLSPMQSWRVGRAVLNQKHNRSIGMALWTRSQRFGALNGVVSDHTYSALSRRGQQAV